MTEQTVTCEIDTCGENRESGEAWPAIATVEDDHGRLYNVCSCHLDGWYQGWRYVDRTPTDPSSQD